MEKRKGKAKQTALLYEAASKGISGTDDLESRICTLSYQVKIWAPLSQTSDITPENWTKLRHKTMTIYL